MEIDVKGKVWNGKSWKENQERKIGQRKNQAYRNAHQMPKILWNIILKILSPSLYGLLTLLNRPCNLAATLQASQGRGRLPATYLNT